MSEHANMMLVVRDEQIVSIFRATLEVERRVRLTVALTAQDALRMAHEIKPDLIVCAPEITGMNVFAFCQQVKQDPATADTMLVLIIPAGANDQRFAGLTFGVDEYLPHPLEPAEILTKLHGMLRFKRIHDELRADREQLKEMHDHLRASFDQLLQLMVRMVDMRIPGADERGRRIAELALQISARFGIPEPHLRDLEIACRLYELGRIVSAEDVHAALPSARAVDAWHYMTGTQAIFSKVPGLEGAAELAGAVYENWDGTGHPNHIRQGQIPLRSRILRVLVDLFTELNAPDKPSQERVLEDLQDHVGTRYDPMVLVHLRAVMQSSADADVQGKRQVVPVSELAVGMVLAEDLFTNAGIKLLARGTRITHATLELILRRHSLEPIVQGAAVLRESKAA